MFAYKYRAIADIDIPSMPQQEVITAYLPLVKSVASQIIAKCPANIELDDLVNVGVIGLMDAAERFSPEYGKPFRFYAELRIRGEILDELRSNDWVPRSTRKKFDLIEKTRQELEREMGPYVSATDVAEKLGFKLERYHRVTNRFHTGTFVSVEDMGLSDDDTKDIYEVLRGSAPDPDALLRSREQEDDIRDAIRSLPHREKLLISLYYYQELSLKEIGKVLGVTESRASQMHTKALARLQKGHARNQLEPTQ